MTVSWQQRWLGTIALGIGMGVTIATSVSAQLPPREYNAADTQVAQPASVEQLARLTTVRILGAAASGSGVIVQRQGAVYTVLTNWHVASLDSPLTLLTPDGRAYHPNYRTMKQLGKADLAIVQFHSPHSYSIASINAMPVKAGEPVYAAGFPMDQSARTMTLNQGIRDFQCTQGVVTLLLAKSLDQGYRLGYTNIVKVGMSGGPIFNQQGQLVGVNGRLKGRDPSFGVYSFEDGTEPEPALLEQMIQSSWGIPITTYLQLIASSLGSSV